MRHRGGSRLDLGRLLIIPLIAFFAGAGCAAGPRFEGGPEPNSVPPDKVLVYIIRESTFVAGGVVYRLSVGNPPVPLVDLASGGYYPHLTEPGILVYAAKRAPYSLGIPLIDSLADIALTTPRPVLTLRTQPGRTYFALFDGNAVTMSRLSKQEGMALLQQSKLLEPLTK